MTRARPGVAAFTVPEVLAVVAIIVIVISLLLPGLGKSREVVRKTICASNLHQQGISMIAYTVNTKFYPATHAVSQGAVIAIWPTRLRGVDSQRDVFYCPSAPAGLPGSLSSEPALNTRCPPTSSGVSTRANCCCACIRCRSPMATTTGARTTAPARRSAGWAGT